MIDYFQMYVYVVDIPLVVGRLLELWESFEGMMSVDNIAPIAGDH